MLERKSIPALIGIRQGIDPIKIANLVASNAAGKDLQVSRVDNAAIEVSTPVPEPASFVLLGAGYFSLPV